ncbi:TRAP transporter large permease [Ammoniphilus sp. CFH 90114]|uniref:TRAP transporter large permease n=1 Tax=Ammoniphilus sp. CFH 90114 TaxID=2493665 RepID=UPI00100EDBC8|nr:TRAP transporter large permease [Ammoniphilus sp. CFH 90114]RXT04796.1 TRAP transporter large permease [Ammoniphilus sp. CFH 90114]
MVLILSGLLVLFMIIGVPIAISLSMAAIGGLVAGSGTIPLTVISQRLFTAVDSFPLLAIPFFLLAGELMMVGTMAQRITNFAFACVGWVRAGLAQVSTLACMFFAGISGSGAADTVAVGKMMIPVMEKKGYDKGFASATVATAGTIAVVIPPSIPMIVYGVTAGVSIGALFTAGIIPGILIGLSIMALNYYIARKKGYDKEKGKFEVVTFRKSLKEGVWALMLPVIIIVGIRGGVFTPTESAAIAAAYALVVGMFIYKDLKLRDLPEVFMRAAIMTAMVMFIIAGANLFGWLLAAEQVPQKLAAWILALTDNKYYILMLINVVLFIAGCLLNASAAITILTPLLLPLAIGVGIDPVFLGLVMVVNLSIGLITPPVGLNLFIVQGISNISFGHLVRGVLPFILVLTIDLLIITYFPQLSMWLPNLLGP